jgi:G3E family GTPase
LPPGFVDPDAVTTAAPAEWPAPAEADHSPGLAALALTADRPLDWLKFDRWFRRIRLTFGAHILRVKGLLRVGGWRGPLALHAIHHVMHPPVAWPDWPDADRRTRLIFILQDLDQGILRAAWRDALAELEAAPVLDPMA